MRRLLAPLFMLFLAVGLIACAAPQAAEPPATAGAPAAATSPPAPNLSCRTDADCTVKNVGNCCGYYPACVNKDAVVDPAAVQAQCRASGRMSVCGFREIASCACVQGKCAASDSGVQSLLPAEK
jgi:hypothetical protein